MLGAQLHLPAFLHPLLLDKIAWWRQKKNVGTVAEREKSSFPSLSFS